MVSCHSAKCDGYRHSGSGDIMVFECHMILQDHVIKVLTDAMVWIPSWYVTILLRLVAIGYKRFSFSQDVARPHNERVMWLYG